MFSIYEFTLCNDNSLMQVLDTIYFEVVGTCVTGLRVVNVVH